MRFAGLWLKVPEAVLQRRLSSREAGASDATTEILKRQLSLPVGRMDWAILDSGEQDADGTLATVERLLALRNPSRSG
jgi:predicted kinase